MKSNNTYATDTNRPMGSAVVYNEAQSKSDGVSRGDTRRLSRHTKITAQNDSERRINDRRPQHRYSPLKQHGSEGWVIAYLTL